MKLYSLTKFCAFAAIVYITLGDVFLPQPYKTNSQEVRHNINEYLISLFPTERLSKLQRNRSLFQNWEEGTPGSANSPL